MSTPVAKCRHCNKSWLSLLLLRPSPISRSAALAPSGAGNVKADADDIAGVTPQRALSNSRFVLRLLRAGYVHLYLPSPPSGVKNWLSYRVTEQAELYAQSNALFVPTGADTACRREGHNAAGIKLLEIPQAHLISEVWMAFSANLWSDSLKARNAANPSAMQRISLAGPSPNSFKPTADALKSKVLECALPSLTIGSTKEQEFAFNGMRGGAEDLAQELERVASCHPATRGKQLAVVLRDPVGVTTELNALRLRAQEQAQQEIARERAKPENQHPLQSSEALLTIRQLIVDENEANAEKRLRHDVMTKAQFDALEGTYNKAPYRDGPPYWEPLEPTLENLKVYGPGAGLRRLPGHEDDYELRAREAARLAWEKMEARFYNEPERKAWVDAFDARMQTTYADKVIAWEDDWWSSRSDLQFGQYFALHFDEADTNDPKERHSPGATYAGEVVRALTPGPLSNSVALQAYVDEILKPPTDPTALLWRTLVGNQKELLIPLQAVADSAITASGAFAQHAQDATARATESATWKSTAVALQKDRFDKLYDLLKGVITLSMDAKNPNMVQQAVRKYSWLSHGLGDKLGLYALSMWMSLGHLPVALTVYRGAAWAAKTAQAKRLVDRILQVGCVQQTIEQANKLLKEGKGALAVPMLIGLDYSVAEAKARLNARGGVSARQLRRASAGGRVTLYLLTDSAELARYEGQLEKAIAGGTGTLSVKPGALAAAGEKLPGAISRQTFENLWNAKRNVSGASSAWLGTLDGRLALGGLLVNLFAIKKSLSELGEAPKEAGERVGRERTNKQIGVIDAFAGTLGAGIEVYQVLIKENVVKRAQGAAVARGAAGQAVIDAGEVAVKASATLSWLRALGGLFGFVGGALAAVVDFRKAQDAAAAGHNDLKRAYYGAAIAFIGVSGSSAATMTGAIAEAILKSRAKSAAARAAIELLGEAALKRTAARLGAEATLGIIELSIPGIGWICLAIGLGAEFWIAWRTPTALQTWVSRSYFGVRTGKDAEHAPFPRGQWQVEYDALLKMFEPAPPPSEGAGKTDTSGLEPNFAGALG